MGLFKYSFEYLKNTLLWEKSLKVCNKMEQIFKKNIYNYEELSTILIWKSKLYELICFKERVYPNYFKVNFIGRDYESQLQVKIFTS